RPGKAALDTVQELLVSVVLMGRRRQLLPGGDENLEHGPAAIGIIAREKEPDLYRTNLDGLFRRVDSGRTLLHDRPPMSNIIRHLRFGSRSGLNAGACGKTVYNIAGPVPGSARSLRMG